MDIADFWRSIAGTVSWSHTEKIKLFAWYCHTYRAAAYFTPSQIKTCFTELGLDGPPSINPFLTALESKKPKEVLRSRDGYRLESRVMQRFDELYGRRSATIAVHKLLTELPTRVLDITERVYLEEALVCFKHGAFRAAIVMSWNLAFDHLCNWVMKHHLPAFNSQLPRSFPRADVSSVAKRDDFTELKESQVLQVCNSSNIISSSIYKVLKGKLDKRNLAAHPSGVSISQLTAEEFIKDLIENVVLKLT